MLFGGRNLTRRILWGTNDLFGGILMRSERGVGMEMCEVVILGVGAVICVGVVVEVVFLVR